MPVINVISPLYGLPCLFYGYWYILLICAALLIMSCSFAIVNIERWFLIKRVFAPSSDFSSHHHNFKWHLLNHILALNTHSRCIVYTIAKMLKENYCEQSLVYTTCIIFRWITRNIFSVRNIMSILDILDQFQHLPCAFIIIFPRFEVNANSISFLLHWALIAVAIWFQRGARQIWDGRPQNKAI